MSNFLQHSHKMVEHQMRTLEGFSNELLLEKIAELASHHGLVHSVEKIGDENQQGNSWQRFLISFYKASDAMEAAYVLEGKMFGKDSLILNVVLKN